MKFNIQYLPGIQDYLVHDDFDMYYSDLREIEYIYNLCANALIYILIPVIDQNYDANDALKAVFMS